GLSRGWPVRFLLLLQPVTTRAGSVSGLFVRLLRVGSVSPAPGARCAVQVRLLNGSFELAGADVSLPLFALHAGGGRRNRSRRSRRGGTALITGLRPRLGGRSSLGLHLFRRLWQPRLSLLDQ